MNKKIFAILATMTILVGSLIVVIFVLLLKQNKTTNTDIDVKNIPNQMMESIFNLNKREKADSESSLKIGDTGQDKCYDFSNQIACPSERESFFGQDSQYLSHEPSFKDNGDKTITDLNTGLVWTKEVYGKYDYSSIPEINVAGHSDWRVPTIKELYTLMDFRGVNPTSMDRINSGVSPFIDRDYFDFEYGNTSDGDRIIDSQWATSSIYVSKVMNNEECFFGVNFADGRIKCYPTKKGKKYFVRYVRGEISDNNFIDNGDKTIADKTTGLIWQKNDNGVGVNWDKALKYCEDLSLAGYSDWRLPNIKELQFIVDYSRSPDTTNSPAINPIFDTTKITNEDGKSDFPFFWSSTTHLNENGANSAAYISFGRALGYMNGRWMDVHGAGAQRSDLKTGSPSDFPTGMGPQGDARRSENYVRCVRGGAKFIEVKSEPKEFNSKSKIDQTQNPQSLQDKQSFPREAINACGAEGSFCSFVSSKGKVTGTCKKISGQIACVP